MEDRCNELISIALDHDSQNNYKNAYFSYRKAIDILNRDPSVKSIELMSHCLERVKHLLSLLNGDELKENHSSLENLEYLSLESEDIKEKSLIFTNKSLPSTPSKPKFPSLPIKKASIPQTKSSEDILSGHSKIPSERDFTQIRKMYERKLVEKQTQKSEKIRAQSFKQHVGESKVFVENLIKGRKQRKSRKILDLFSSITNRAKEWKEDLRTTIEWEHRRKSIKKCISMNEKKDSDDFYLIEPILGCFTDSNDPTATLVREYVERTRELLEKEELSTVINELCVVEDLLVELFQSNFEELSRDSLIVSIKISIQKFFFQTCLYSQLMFLFRNQNIESNLELFNKTIKIQWHNVLDVLKIKKRFHLDICQSFPISGCGSYAEAVEELRLISIYTTPIEKLLCLTRCCSMTCSTIEEYSRLHSAVESHFVFQEESIGSEDLVYLCALMITFAQIPDLQSHVRFVCDFIPAEILRGEAGYVLATMQTAINFIINI